MHAYKIIIINRKRKFVILRKHSNYRRSQCIALQGGILSIKLLESGNPQVESFGIATECPRNNKTSLKKTKHKYPNNGPLHISFRLVVWLFISPSWTSHAEPFSLGMKLCNSCIVFVYAISVNLQDLTLGVALVLQFSRLHFQLKILRH